MAVKIRSSQLESRTQRAKLTPRGNPYVVTLAPGIRLGYRRTKALPGTWCVKVANGKGSSWQKDLNALADDIEDGDGKLIMNYWQACDLAKKLARATDGPANSDRPATLKEALEDYKRHLEGRGQPGAQVGIIINRLTPSLAETPVSMMTDKQAVAFRDHLLATGIKRNTTTRYWATFCAAMTRAAKLDKRIKNTPWKLEALPSDTEARNVILPDAKVSAIVAAGYRLDPAFWRAGGSARRNRYPHQSGPQADRRRFVAGRSVEHADLKEGQGREEDGPPASPDHAGADVEVDHLDTTIRVAFMRPGPARRDET
jgi:hypothetical protein